MPATSTMNVELAGCRVVHQVKEFGDLRFGGSCLSSIAMFSITHVLRFDIAFFFRRVVG